MDQLFNDEISFLSFKNNWEGFINRLNRATQLLGKILSDAERNKIDLTIEWTERIQYLLEGLSSSINLIHTLRGVPDPYMQKLKPLLQHIDLNYDWLQTIKETKSSPGLFQ